MNDIITLFLNASLGMKFMQPDAKIFDIGLFVQHWQATWREPLHNNDCSSAILN